MPLRSLDRLQHLNFMALPFILATSLLLLLLPLPQIRLLFQFPFPFHQIWALYSWRPLCFSNYPKRFVVEILPSVSQLRPTGRHFRFPLWPVAVVSLAKRPRLANSVTKHRKVPANEFPQRSEWNKENSQAQSRRQSDNYKCRPDKSRVPRTSIN